MCKTTMTISKKNKKIIKDLTNKYDFRTQNAFISAMLKVVKQFKPELKRLKK